MAGTRTTSPVLETRCPAPGVFAYLQPDGGWCLNNAGLVVGDDGRGLLVDTFATAGRTRRLRRAVLRDAPAAPRMLVNTHFHGDHTFGNSAFPEALVIGHERTRTAMAEHGLHLTGLWPEVCWGDIDLVLPQLTYRDALTVHLGGVRVEVFHLGPAAHTTDDTVVWLPEQRVLFTGDVVMSGVTPFCVMGSVAGSLAALARLADLGPATVVPGHGPMGGPELIEANAGYFRWIQELAARGHAAGRPPLETAARTGRHRYAGWVDAERLLPNLHRAYAELRGAGPGDPLDIAAIFAEMARYHGAPPRCRA